MIGELPPFLVYDVAWRGSGYTFVCPDTLDGRDIARSWVLLMVATALDNMVTPHDDLRVTRRS